MNISPEHATYALHHLPGVVYLAVPADAKTPTKVKVGYTMDIHERMRRLKCRPIATIASGPDLERFLHHLFAEQRLDGEWFSLDGDILDLLTEMRDMGEQRAWAS